MGIYCKPSVLFQDSYLLVLTQLLCWVTTKEQKEEQMIEYSWRTSLVKDQFHEGKAAVTIQNVQESDSGIYVCHFKQGHFHEEAILELKVAAWRKAQLYADWRKEHFQTWTFTLDPASAHPTLVISQDRMRVTRKDTTVCLDDLFSVLGTKGISSGRYYWEVKLANREGSKWILGVCREGVERKGFYFESPEKGFWTVGQSSSGYWAYVDSGRDSLSIRQAPQSVGVFVDYDKRNISFYNMSDKSHLFSFHEASFSGTLLPYFQLKSGNVLMTVSSMAFVSEGQEGEEGEKGKEQEEGKEEEETPFL